LGSIEEKAAKHDTMKKEMAKAMKDAQGFAGLRVGYGERELLQFPKWLKSEVA
jgi:hypothetical protein